MVFKNEIIVVAPLYCYTLHTKDKNTQNGDVETRLALGTIKPSLRAEVFNQREAWKNNDAKR